MKYFLTRAIPVAQCYTINVTNKFIQKKTMLLHTIADEYSAYVEKDMIKINFLREFELDLRIRKCKQN